ncbi:MAG: lipid-A-disaccharide synthase [Chlamydiae bacterium]|nr:lipid-A-disaccharide synthase [Chlamydiota bacterium]
MDRTKTDITSNFDLFIIAGEASGDVHGAKILHALQKKNPEMQTIGIAGPKMREMKIHCFLPMESFQIMGFIQVFKNILKFIRLFYKTAGCILKVNPKVVLLIDYPGFNLRLAKYLRKKGFTGEICQYICPSVWAWNKKRISLIEKNFTQLFCILPFEPGLFKDPKLLVKYVGHPLIKNQPKRVVDDANLKCISIFPGSREREILSNLPIHLKAAEKIHAKFPDLVFGISISQDLFFPLIDSLVKKHPSLPIQYYPAKDKGKLMDLSLLAFAKSGTITLELALNQIPTVVTYAISKLDLIIAKNILKISLPFYCLPNIILNSPLFPELFGPFFTEELLLSHALRFLSSEQDRNQCRENCAKIYDVIGNLNAEEEVANELYNLCR